MLGFSAVTSAQPVVETIKNPLLNRADMKKKQLIEALESADGNQSRAADILGVSRVTVWNRMKKYFLDLFLINIILGFVLFPLLMVWALDGRGTPGGVLLNTFAFAY